MSLSAKQQKWLKCLHLAGVCFWFGGAFSIGSLHYLRLFPESVQGALYGIDKASRTIDVSIVIIGGAVLCLLTGLAYSLWTGWGFLKHRWIAYKWAATIFCILFGTFMLGPLEKELVALSGAMGDAALASAQYESARFTHFICGNVQRFFLLTMIVVSVLRPWKKAAGREDDSRG